MFSVVVLCCLLFRVCVWCLRCLWLSCAVMFLGCCVLVCSVVSGVLLVFAGFLCLLFPRCGVFFCFLWLPGAALVPFDSLPSPLCPSWFFFGLLCCLGFLMVPRVPSFFFCVFVFPCILLLSLLVLCSLMASFFPVPSLSLVS